jgi:hypothetical protein
MGKQRARAAYRRKKQPIQSPLHQIERRAEEMDCRAQDLVERGLSALCSARWQSSSWEQHHGLRAMARRTAAELEAELVDEKKPPTLGTKNATVFYPALPKIAHGPTFAKPLALPPPPNCAARASRVHAHAFSAYTRA